MEIKMLFQTLGLIFIIAYVSAEDNDTASWKKDSDKNEPTTQTNETSITNHPNLRLLPQETCGYYIPRKILVPGLLPSSQPWTVLLRQRIANRRTFFSCGGVLISKRYVLTAAHCLKNNELPTSAVIDQVRVGEYDLETEIDCVHDQCSPPAENFEIEEKIVHSYFNIYDKTKQNDIALIRLKTPVKFRDEVQPICLPLRDIKVINNEKPMLSTVGWGITYNGKQGSPEKQEQLLTMIPFEECSAHYSKLNFSVRESQICAEGTGEKICQGDSGGPLMIEDNFRWYLQGIFSNKPMRCKSSKSTGIYTKVVDFMGWILDNIRE